MLKIVCVNEYINIDYYFQQSKFIMQDLMGVKNKYNNKLKCTLIRHRLSLLQKVQQDFTMNQKPKGNNLNNKQKCIVYLHGLGSNRIEGLSILPHLPKGYCLLTFDLSGSGKSQGQNTTYGFRQKQDIESVLTYLYKQKDLRVFIIWGRSMGAVATLLFNNMMAQKQNQTVCEEQGCQGSPSQTISLFKLYKCVKCIIADSPFSSFESISKDIALNKMSIPSFFIDIALTILRNVFEKILHDKKSLTNFTPFQIDFTKYSLKPVVPVIFIYSLNDEVVNWEHTQIIIKSIQKSRFKMIDKVIIPECGHNMKRPQNVIQAIFDKIQKHLINSKNTLQSNQNQRHFSSGKRLQTKNVRRKSFWNFQQQFVEGQNQKNENPISQIEKTSNFSNTINQKTARKNIFSRDQSKDCSASHISNAKKRGLSLSSTIQRQQSQPQIKEKLLNQSLMKTMKVYKNSKKRQNPSQPNDYLGNGANLSLQNVDLFRKNNQESMVSPRKGKIKRSAELLSYNCKQSGRKRLSLGGNMNRISLGGSVQKQPVGLKNSSQHLKSKCKFNIQNNIAAPVKTIQYSHPQHNQPTRQGGLLTLSSYGYSKSQQPTQQIDRGRNEQSQMRFFGVNSQQSLPLASGEQPERFERDSSRQSLKTIDIRLMNSQVDEGLTTFINKKLEYNFYQTPFLTNAVFNKNKTLQLGAGQPLKEKNTKNTLILPETDNKQRVQSSYNNYKNNSMTSTISGSGHISLRPSNRLYHQKKRKKLQGQISLINKPNQNMKITNQRYLIQQ